MTIEVHYFGTKIMFSATVEFIENLAPEKKLMAQRRLKIFTYSCFALSACVFALAVIIAIYAVIRFAHS